jgi:hypothetical protein
LAASSLGNLNPDEQTLVNQFYDTNNKLGDKKYLIDKQATYDNESLKILTSQSIDSLSLSAKSFQNKSCDSRLKSTGSNIAHILGPGKLFMKPLSGGFSVSPIIL